MQKVLSKRIMSHLSIMLQTVPGGNGLMTGPVPNVEIDSITLRIDVTGSTGDSFIKNLLLHICVAPGTVALHLMQYTGITLV